MWRWLLLLGALVGCSRAILLPANVSRRASAAPRAQFYLVAMRPVGLNLTTCEPAAPPTCALNDQEASYVVHRAVRESGMAHILLDGRTVRTEFALQAAAGQLATAVDRRAALDRSAAILANSSSALLSRPLDSHELSLVTLSVTRNVPRCVQLSQATIRDMWVGFVYRQAQQVNVTASDPIGQFVVMSVLFLAQNDKPASRPDALQFSQFVRKRLAQLVSGDCTPVAATTPPSAQLAVLRTERKVIQLVTVLMNGTVTVKEVTPAEVVKHVPFAPPGDGTIVVTPTVA